MAIIVFIAIKLEINRIASEMFTYDNPLVIISSVSLLLAFQKLKFQNKLINRLAASCFAVFLLHTNPNLCIPYFIPMIKDIYAEYSGALFIFYITSTLILIFMISIFIDQIRITIYKYLQPIFEKITYYFY